MHRKRNLLCLFGILAALLSSCAYQAPQVDRVAISIASRGESLGITMTPPEPVVLPAATTEAVETPAEALEKTPAGEPANDFTQPQTCVVSVNLQFEAEVVRLVNEARLNAGLTKLSEHALLTQVARAHSTEMACGGFLSHDSPTGGPADARVGAAGYKFSAVAENVAMGYETPEAVVDAWLASPGHRENLLGSGYSQIGIGFGQLDDEAQTQYWTIILASPANP